MAGASARMAPLARGTCPRGLRGLPGGPSSVRDCLRRGQVWNAREEGRIPTKDSRARRWRIGVVRRESLPSNGRSLQMQSGKRTRSDDQENKEDRGGYWEPEQSTEQACKPSRKAQR
ncbi:unnamed protein product [Lampetra fluviatilis]